MKPVSSDMTRTDGGARPLCVSWTVYIKAFKCSRKGVKP